MSKEKVIIVHGFIFINIFFILKRVINNTLVV